MVLLLSLSLIIVPFWSLGKFKVFVMTGVLSILEWFNKLAGVLLSTFSVFFTNCLYLLENVNHKIVTSLALAPRKKQSQITIECMFISWLYAFSLLFSGVVGTWILKWNSLCFHVVGYLISCCYWCVINTAYFCLYGLLK